MKFKLSELWIYAIACGVSLECVVFRIHNAFTFKSVEARTAQSFQFITRLYLRARRLPLVCMFFRQNRLEALRMKCCPLAK